MRFPVLRQKTLIMYLNWLSSSCMVYCIFITAYTFMYYFQKGNPVRHHEVPRPSTEDPDYVLELVLQLLHDVWTLPELAKPYRLTFLVEQLYNYLDLVNPFANNISPRLYEDHRKQPFFLKYFILAYYPGDLFLTFLIASFLDFPAKEQNVIISWKLQLLKIFQTDPTNLVELWLCNPCKYSNLETDFFFRGI